MPAVHGQMHVSPIWSTCKTTPMQHHIWAFFCRGKDAVLSAHLFCYRLTFVRACGPDQVSSLRVVCGPDEDVGGSELLNECHHPSEVSDVCIKKKHIEKLVVTRSTQPSAKIPRSVGLSRRMKLSQRGCA